MARANSKSSPADTAALIAIFILIAAILVLFGIYFLRQNGFLQFENTSAEETLPHVIGSETTAVSEITETTTTTVTTTAIAAVSESSETTTESETEIPEDGSNPAKEVPTEYDKEFYNSVLMIGDSLSVGLVNYGFLQPENVFAKVGLTPASVMTTEIDEKLVYDKAAELSPSYICIMLGTNGLSYLSEDYMAEKMGEFIDELEIYCPDAEIVLVSIPPVTEAHEKEKPEKLENITAYNEHIKNVADEKSVKYVDTFSLLQGVTGYLADDFAENDGLHFKAAAYPVVLSAVQTAITGGITPAEETTTAVTSETSAASSETTTVPTVLQ